MSRRGATTLRRASLPGRAGRSSVAGSSSGVPAASATRPAPRQGAAAQLPGSEQEGNARDGAGPACAPAGAPVRNRVPGAADSVSVVTSGNVLMPADPRSGSQGRRMDSFSRSHLDQRSSSTCPDLQELPFAFGDHKALLPLIRKSMLDVDWAYMDDITCFCVMPSPLALCHYLPGELSVESRPCSSPLVVPRKAGKLFLGVTPPQAPRLPRGLAWYSIDWEQVCLLHRLGSGGFGSVYKATYHGVPVAIKQVNKCTKNPRASQRSFWAELNIARLRHDNIVRVVAASTHTPKDSNSLGTIIMEFGGNVTLHQVIYGSTRSPGPLSCSREHLSLGKCLKYSLDIVNGLLFLHSQSILHLDLKPANILINEKDVCKISDFGCSQKLQDLWCSQTPPHHIGGTYTHQAPELLKGETATPKADIYSFGITLWQMTTREVPYSGEPQQVQYAVVAYNLRPSLAGAVFTASPTGQTLQSILRSCWEARALQRPGAELLLRDLNALQAALG